MVNSWNGPQLGSPIRTDVPELQKKLIALLKQDPTSVANIPSGAKRLVNTSGVQWQVQQYNGSSWAAIGKLMHDVDKLDGYHAAITPNANTVAVRNANKQLEGDITGNAATASSATTLSETLPVNKGGTGATTSAQARKNLGAAPTSHASSSTTYGLGSNANYGHVRGDGVTTNVVSGEVVAKDVAIGGNSADLASARGQIGKRISLSGIDYNSLVKFGHYVVEGRGSTNTPTGTETTFYVDVFETKYSSTTRILQIAYRSDNAQQYVRSSQDIGETWLQWAKSIYNTDYATASTPGIVKPGTGMTVDSAGALNVSLNNTVTSTSTTQAASAYAVYTVNNPTATGTTEPRSLAERFGDIVNVKDFGAKGDGVTDDTQAVQAATNRALDLGAGVYFPGGSYVVTSVYDSSLLYGEGLLLMAGAPVVLPSVLRCSARIDAATEYSAELANAITQLDSTKMDKAQASAPFNFRGSVLFADLPDVGDVNDTYYVTDRQYNMTWDGSKWSQSSAPVSGLSDLIDNCIQGHPQNVDADNMVELCSGDIDKLLVNRVYAIASNTGILNTPVADMGGLYLPMGKLSSLTGATGAIFITFDRQLYVRIWNATASRWEAWRRLVNDTELGQVFQGHPNIITASNMVAVCNGDASNLLPERVYIIAAGTGIKGLPEDTGGSYLVYNRGPLLSAGATAIFVTLTGNMYYRNRPNSSGVWSAWHRVVDQAYLAPYVHGVTVITAENAESVCANNLDTLASNTIHTVATGITALAGTPVPGEGGCLTVLSRNAGNASGSCRLFHSYSGDLSHASRSGSGWNPWKRAVSHDIPRVLALGDSICYGARNSYKGFVGDLHYETKNVGISGTRLSSTHPSAEPIFKQLDSVGDFQPDVIIFDGGINDYVQHVPLGEVATAPTAPTSTDTLLGGMQKLLYEIKTRYPFCQVFFVAVHKMQYAPIGYCPATNNSAGYTQTDMTNAQKELCRVFGVQVVDVFGESLLDTSFSAYLGAVGSDAWCDDDGVHPLPNGYIHAYVPLIKRALISVTRK